jgi:hypothetical protein
MQRNQQQAWVRHALPALVGATLLAAPTAARAHEPLWGETPTVFGFGVIHPELKAEFLRAGRLRQPGDERMRMWMQELMIGYAPSTAVNLRIMIPLMNGLHEMRMADGVQSVPVSGFGDTTIQAKHRFAVRQDIGLNIQHSVIAGIKLPTGRSNLRAADGGRLEPHHQPGTGNFGIRLGYAADRETIDDTIWGSVIWTRDLGGGFRMGDMLQLTAAYGRWVVVAREAADWGVNLALGLHADIHTGDILGGGRRAGNSHSVLGLHFTPIVTKGNHQFRVGVFVPFARSGPADHVDFPFEFRAAFETFF